MGKAIKHRLLHESESRVNEPMAENQRRKRMLAKVFGDYLICGCSRAPKIEVTALATLPTLFFWEDAKQK
jgi:hypothetical protein